MNKTKQHLNNQVLFSYILVRMERLELSHLAALEPKSSASTNFATSASMRSAIIGKA